MNTERFQMTMIDNFGSPISQEKVMDYSEILAALLTSPADGQRAMVKYPDGTTAILVVGNDDDLKPVLRFECSNRNPALAE